MAYKFRLYPSKTQDTEMRRHLFISKNIWNELLAFCKECYAKTKKFPKKTELQYLVKGKGLYPQTQQCISHRVYESIKRVFTLRKKGVKCGFPRFKNIERMKSLHYPQSGFNLGKKLSVTPFGEMAIKKHRKIKGKVKTMILKCESSGKWFAIFTADKEIHPQVNKGKQAGLDLGLISFATISDGTIINNPSHLKKYETKLTFLQRNLSKCRKDSKNWIKAKHKVALLHEKIANARRDFLHKISTKLTSTYSLLALEELAVKNMAERQFGKSIYDAGWSMFMNMLRYKAEEAGCKVMFVNPKNTTKECSKCGVISEKTLTDRLHNCPSCGYSTDRDLNAAEVILNRATAGHAECNAYGLAAAAT